MGEEYDSDEEAAKEPPAMQPPGIALENLGTFRRLRAPLWLRLENQRVHWKFSQGVATDKLFKKGRIFIEQTEASLLETCQETGVLPPGPVPPGFKLLCMPEPKVEPKDETAESGQNWDDSGDWWHREQLPELQCMASKCKNLHRSTMLGPIVHLPYIWNQGLHAKEGIPPVAAVRFRDPNWRSWTPRCMPDAPGGRKPLENGAKELQKVKPVLDAPKEESQGVKRSADDQGAASRVDAKDQNAASCSGKKSRKLKQLKTSASSPKDGKVKASFKCALSSSQGSVALDVSSCDAGNISNKVHLPFLNSQAEQSVKEEQEDDEILAEEGEDVD